MDLPSSPSTCPPLSRHPFSEGVGTGLDEKKRVRGITEEEEEASSTAPICPKKSKKDDPTLTATDLSPPPLSFSDSSAVTSSTKFETSGVETGAVRAGGGGVDGGGTEGGGVTSEGAAADVTAAVAAAKLDPNGPPAWIGVSCLCVSFTRRG